MAVRKVLLYPDPLLKRVCAPAPDGEELERMIEDNFIEGAIRLDKKHED